jgi:hypothetical protein
MEEEVKQILEPEAEEDCAEEVEVSPFQLLDRLFEFIADKDEQLNAVLAGYFSKLVTQLLNRK